MKENKKLEFPCVPETDEFPTYGIFNKSVNDIELKKIKNELKSFDLEMRIGKTESNHKFRSVLMSRIPRNSYIAEFFTKKAIEINEVFGYFLDGLEDIQYLEYNSDDFYDYHVDISNSIASRRKISMSLILNPNEFTGGDLVFFDAGKEIISEKSNNIIAFTSFMNHKVTKIESGTRKALVCWVSGLSWR
tara:strand:+ start:1984 stop:2553 length:570 start_codon:yes stop_codon:yes gene_type:complete